MDNSLPELNELRNNKACEPEDACGVKVRAWVIAVAGQGGWGQRDEGEGKMDNPFRELNGFTPANSNPPRTPREEGDPGPQGSGEAGDRYVTCQKRRLDKPQREASKLERKLSTVNGQQNIRGNR